MDSSTYEGALATARLIYDTMLARAGGPLSVRVREFDTKVKSHLSNSYLHFENIREAALEGDFQRIRIGYYRTEEWVATKAEQNQGRRNFIEWAVDMLKRRLPEETSKAELLRLWSQVPLAEKKKTSANPTTWFKNIS